MHVPSSFRHLLSWLQENKHNKFSIFLRYSLSSNKFLSVLVWPQEADERKELNSERTPSLKLKNTENYVVLHKSK